MGAVGPKNIPIKKNKNIYQNYKLVNLNKEAIVNT